MTRAVRHGRLQQPRDARFQRVFASILQRPQGSGDGAPGDKIPVSRKILTHYRGDILPLRRSIYARGLMSSVTENVCIVTVRLSISMDLGPGEEQLLLSIFGL